MTRTTPRIQNETLFWQNGGEIHRLTIETPDWYAWLEQASIFAFEGSTSTFTARKERVRHGGAYWRAYRRRKGKLYRAYVGKSSEVTLERLKLVAAALERDSTVDDHAAKGGGQRHEGQRALAGLLSAALTQSSQSIHVEQTVKPPPLPLTSLVGRELEIAHVCVLLKEEKVRLLNIIGPGGVGKTRLALHVADRLRNDFPTGIFFISLAPIHDPLLVLPAVAHALGLRNAEQPSALERVQDYVQDKRLLLVLDNLEHLIESASQLEQLLIACPRVKLLVTSRTVLHIQGEHEFPMLPLALPDLATLSTPDVLARYPAVALFVQRAQAVLPTFQLTSENAHLVVAICARLDGLPLAIELAAAHIKLFPPQALLNQLSRRVHPLIGRTQTLPVRQQTLRGTFQWSYGLLSPEEQRILRLLCVFVGGCTLEAIEAVSQVEGREKNDIANVIFSLMDHSLVQQRTQEGDVPRLHLLETIREYGRERLEEQGELEESQRAHARWYLRFVEEISPPQRGGGARPVWLESLTVEQENLRAALHFLIEHKEAELALRLCSALWWFWVTRGSFSEGRGFLEAALALPYSGGRTAPRAKALSAAGELAFRQGNYTRARSLEEEGIAIYQELDDRRGLAEALRNLGLVYIYQGNFATALPLIERSVDLCRELEDIWMLGQARDSQARLAWKQGDLQTARLLCEEELQIGLEIGEVRAQICPRKMLASIALIQGDYMRAAILAQELLTIAETINDQESQLFALFTLGDVAKSQDDDRRALRFYQQSLAITQATDGRRNRSIVLSRLGDLALKQENYEQAVALYRESLSLAHMYEDTLAVGWSLLGLARIAKAERRYWRAAVLSSAGEAHLNPALDLDQGERKTYERHTAALQTYMGKEEYLQARAEGRTMTPEQALSVQEPLQATSPSTSSIYPDGLTAREVEILRFVALGWTDAQVAEKLVISPRTVQGHLRSVYSKINVTSRSAATRYVVEHGLA